MMEVIVALGFILCGLLLIALARKFKLGLGEASNTAILLAPTLVYLIVSEKIVQFEGPGWKATFREIATERVIAAVRASDLAITSREASQPDFFSEAFWGACRPYYSVTERTAKSPSGELDAQATLRIATAIRTSIICGRFRALVVVDDERKPVGYFIREQFLELLHIPLVIYGSELQDHSKLFQQVARSELGVVLANPVIRAKSDEAFRVTIRDDAQIEAAYDILNKASVDVATIIDRLGRFDGIITRDAIESRIISKIIESGQIIKARARESK